MRSIYVVYQSSCVWWRLERRSTVVSLSGSPGVTGTGDSVSPGKLWDCRRRSILGIGGQAPTCGVSEAGGSWFCAALGTSASGPCCCSELGTTGGLPESQSVWGEPCLASACGAVGNGSGCWGLTASLTGMASGAIKDKSNISDAMNNHFCTIGGVLKSELPDWGRYKEYLPTRVMNSFFIEPICNDDVGLEIRPLNPKIAPGPDCIDGKLIQLRSDICSNNSKKFIIGPFKLVFTHMTWNLPKS